MKAFKGIAASDGIAIASAFRLTEPDLSFKKRTVTDASDEIKRLYAAIDVSKDELLTIQQKHLKTSAAMKLRSLKLMWRFYPTRNY